MNKTNIQGILIIVLVVLNTVSIAQNSNKRPFLDPNVRKLGPYFGIQAGRYYVGEIGMETQYKNIKIFKPKTNAFNVGLEYNIPNNTLGISTGYWHKPSRFDLTYGLDFVLRTNFDDERYGVSPVIGYKIFGFHIRAGYMFLTSSSTFHKTNQLFVNLRFLLVNNRKFKWNKRK